MYIKFVRVYISQIVHKHLILVSQHVTKQSQAAITTQQAAALAEAEALAEALAEAEAEAVDAVVAVDAVDAAVIQNQHQRPDVKDIIVLRIAPTQQRVDATDMYSVVVYIVSNCYAYALTYYLYYYILYNN